MPRKPRTALLVDAENQCDLVGRFVDLDKVIATSRVVARLAVGMPQVGRAMRRALADRGFELVLPVSGGANASDLTLTARGAALLAVRPRVARFVILSGDNDFDALHQVLAGANREVVRIGRKAEAADTPGDQP